MKLKALVPLPQHRETFKRNRARFVPSLPGCYVLTTFEGDVLYIGLSVNLRKRMNNHLDNSQKTGTSKNGRAVFFHWHQSSELNKIERTWLNIHIEHEGILPILNSIYSPTAT